MFETKSIRETCVQLDSDIDKGLSEKEAARRYQENGKNELKEPRKKTVVESFLEQLNDPLIYVLLAAAVISLLLHEVSDAVIIAVVVLMNAFVGMIQDKPACLCDPGGKGKRDSGVPACGGGHCMPGCRLPDPGGSAPYQNKQPEGGGVGPDRGIGTY